ncbi:N-acetyltransferase [Pseudolysinimonas sp.]|uniref:GNAT family N-acetyltransferase n=1 Tax=Pseudolysinimonas sp. TaxID=2680009 RepID=UPI00286AD01B|nr:N-acetyltransferase [Pseudolysinimonas sp.]
MTFPLACPPHTTDEAKAAHIAAHLTGERFDAYLADPARDLYLAEVDPSTGSGRRGEAVGYTMLVAGDPTDPDVAAALTTWPTAELSKCYVLPGHHGAGIASGLMAATLEAARGRGAAAVWLGVNEENERAQAFYRKHGFVVVGRKRFLVGKAYEDDFVMERVF